MGEGVARKKAVIVHRTRRWCRQGPLVGCGVWQSLFERTWASRGMFPRQTVGGRSSVPLPDPPPRLPLKGAVPNPQGAWQPNLRPKPAHAGGPVSQGQPLTSDTHARQRGTRSPSHAGPGHRNVRPVTHRNIVFQGPLVHTALRLCARGAVCHMSSLFFPLGGGGVILAMLPRVRVQTLDIHKSKKGHSESFPERKWPLGE